MSSSTVVYPSRGQLIDANSEVELDGARADRQFRLESIMRSIDADVKIVRLAGLYGPGRIIGKKSIENGELIRGSGDSWLNLVHVEDAAGLLMKVMGSDSAADVELGSDGRPVKRVEYYRELSNALACPTPVFDDVAITRRHASEQAGRLSTAISGRFFLAPSTSPAASRTRYEPAPP